MCALVCVFLFLFSLVGWFCCGRTNSCVELKEVPKEFASTFYVLTETLVHPWVRGQKLDSLHVWPVGSKSPVHCYKNLFNASDWTISTGRQACCKQEQKNTVPRSECFYFRLLFYVIQLIAVMLSAIFYLRVFHWQPKIKGSLYLWGASGSAEQTRRLLTPHSKCRKCILSNFDTRN